MEGDMRFAVPGDFYECLKLEETAKLWQTWAKRVASIGKVGFVCLMVWGIGISVYSLWLSQGSECAIVDFVLSMVKWGIGAGVLYCAFRVISLLFQSLASFLEYVGVMSRLMVFQSAVDGYPDSWIDGNHQWKCGCCGAVNIQK